MNPAYVIAMLICAWLVVCLAMLWGMLRLARHRRPRTAVGRPPAAKAQAHHLGDHAHGH